MNSGSGYWECQPPPDLEAVVVCGWGRAEWAPIPSHIVPDGCVDLIADGRRLLFAGPDRHPVTVTPAARASTIGVRLSIWSAQPLLGVDPRATLERRIPLEDILSVRVSGALRSRLESGTSEERLALLLDFVRRQAADARVGDPVAEAAARSILAAGGDIRIDRLADSLGYGSRHLHRRFCAAIGYGPKTYARIVRFQVARSLLREARPAPVATVARRAGFTDAQHLAREFKALAGRAPTLERSETSTSTPLRSSA